eukprot:1187778-Prorocentrum_minimum.AAC.3
MESQAVGDTAGAAHRSRPFWVSSYTGCATEHSLSSYTLVHLPVVLTPRLIPDRIHGRCLATRTRRESQACLLRPAYVPTKKRRRSCDPLNSQHGNVVVSTRRSRTERSTIPENKGVDYVVYAVNNIASFCGSSCANNGKDALITPESVCCVYAQQA